MRVQSIGTSNYQNQTNFTAVKVCGKGVSIESVTELLKGVGFKDVDILKIKASIFNSFQRVKQADGLLNVLPEKSGKVLDQIDEVEIDFRPEPNSKKEIRIFCNGEKSPLLLCIDSLREFSRNLYDTYCASRTLERFSVPDFCQESIYVK